MQRKVVVTGVTGQDGYYLSRQLLEEGSEVYGVVRRVARPSDGVPDGVIPIDGDVTDPGITQRIAALGADEIYHLAAFSHVGDSFAQPAVAMQTNALGTLHMLEAARLSGARFYQASTSELFGNAPAPQSETTPHDPQSPYAVAKLAAYRMVRLYREAYDVFACNGILFNHESPKRGADFVTQKVAQAAARIGRGENIKLRLGNLDARRDWGHAADYTRGMVMMLRHDMPDDYVLATGRTRTVRELVDVAFGLVGIRDWSAHVEHDPALLRPCEVNHLCGDATKARRVLGWTPTISFGDMIEEMVNAIPARV